MQARVPSVRVPDWFTRAVSTAPEVIEVAVAGAMVRARCWGEPGRGVVLAHGGGAHARWWDHIAPLLATERRVVALDLSGHGASDRRENYELDAWAQEAMAVAAPGGISGRPVIVGHSMGGDVAYMAGAMFAADLDGIVTIDSPLRPDSAEAIASARRRAPSWPLRYYPSASEARARFRTIPADPNAKSYILDYIAAASIVEREQGWTWTFDPAIFLRNRPDPELLREVRCRTAVFSAERGLVTDAMAARIKDLLGGEALVITLPQAGHHVMLDEPLQLVAALRTLLAAWASDGRSR